MVYGSAAETVPHIDITARNAIAINKYLFLKLFTFSPPFNEIK